MKKATTFLLLFLFLFTTSGMAVNVHWCRGKITSVKFWAGEEHGCKCGKKAMKRSCCQDKTIVFKANVDPAKSNQFAIKTQAQRFEILSVMKTEIVSSIQLEHSVSDFYYPPPFKPRTPIFLLDRVIRI